MDDDSLASSLFSEEKKMTEYYKYHVLSVLEKHQHRWLRKVEEEK
jgi:hypothetical protein